MRERTSEESAAYIVKLEQALSIVSARLSQVDLDIVDTALKPHREASYSLKQHNLDVITKAFISAKEKMEQYEAKSNNAHAIAVYQRVYNIHENVKESL